MTLRVKENITDNFQLETAEPEAKSGTLLRAGTVPLTAHWVCSRSPAYTQVLVALPNKATGQLVQRCLCSGQAL